MVRMDATADDSLAAMRARSKFGIAMAAMIRMIATTISSSISEKPFCFRISICPLVRSECVLEICWSRMTQSLRYLHLSRQIRQLPKFQGSPAEGLYFQLHPWLDRLLPVSETFSGWQNSAATLTIRVIQNGQQ